MSQETPSMIYSGVTSNQVVIRDAQGTDLPFIYSTWLKNLYYGSHWFREIDKDRYFDKYKRVVTSLITHSTVKIACLSSEPEVIIGYVVYRGDTLHWVYVKKAWRQMGIAKELVPVNDIRWVSHLTKIGKQLRRKEWRFDPFV